MKVIKTTVEGSKRSIKYSIDACIDACMHIKKEVTKITSFRFTQQEKKKKLQLKVTLQQTEHDKGP